MPSANEIPELNKFAIDTANRNYFKTFHTLAPQTVAETAAAKAEAAKDYTKDKANSASESVKDATSSAVDQLKAVPEGTK